MIPTAGGEPHPGLCRTFHWPQAKPSTERVFLVLAFTGPLREVWLNQSPLENGLDPTSSFCAEVTDRLQATNLLEITADDATALRYLAELAEDRSLARLEIFAAE
jgi:hypothetical protein